MMKHEFEELAGYEVSDQNYYNVIEPMYYASELDKKDFVKVLNKKAFALPTKKQLISKMKELANFIKENSCHFYTGKEEDELRDLAQEFSARFVSSACKVYLNSAKSSVYRYYESISFCNSNYEDVKVLNLI